MVSGVVGVPVWHFDAKLRASTECREGAWQRLLEAIKVELGGQHSRNNDGQSWQQPGDSRKCHDDWGVRKQSNDGNREILLLRSSSLSIDWILMFMHSDTGEDEVQRP